MQSVSQSNVRKFKCPFPLLWWDSVGFVKGLCFALSLETALIKLVFSVLWFKLLLCWLLVVFALTVLFVLIVPFVFAFEGVPAAVTLFTCLQSTTLPALSLATMAKNIPKTSANIKIKSQNEGKQQEFEILLHKVESFNFNYFIWGFRFCVPLSKVLILK